METKEYDVQELNEETLTYIDKAAEVLRNDGLVAFPTETVYGLGANALIPEAVAAIYRAKGRPSDNPLIVHVAGIEGCKELTPFWSSTVEKLVKRFWPGPLTLILPKTERVPDITTGGLSTVAIRMPDNPIALELIKRSGCPIAAPSANLSGRPSPTRPEHVIEDLAGRIDVILKGGDCRVGIESTVLDMTGETPTILRPGILTPEEIEAVIGIKVAIDPALLNRPCREASLEETKDIPAPKAPGMKYTHYAPNAEMLIIQGELSRVRKEIEIIKEENERNGRKVGVILFEEEAFIQAAHDFFARLRELDNYGVDLIIAGALSDRNSIGFAVMNRMLKSAGYKVIKV